LEKQKGERLINERKTIGDIDIKKTSKKVPP